MAFRSTLVIRLAVGKPRVRFESGHSWKVTAAGICARGPEAPNRPALATSIIPSPGEEEHCRVVSILESKDQLRCWNKADRCPTDTASFSVTDRFNHQMV